MESEEGSDSVDTKGQHFVIDAFQCQADILNQEDVLKEFLIKAVEDLGMEILSTYFHSFSPQGVTGVIVLSTSHLSIHTWPEHGYAALDLYTCGDQKLWPVLRELLLKLEAKRASVHEIVRGHDIVHRPSSMKELDILSDTLVKEKSDIRVKNDIGNGWDRAYLKATLKGNHNILYHGSSPFQDLLLIETTDIRLYLNQELQFSSLDERYYHEALVFPAMELAASPKRVLVLGGGDGLAVREILKYPNVEHVDLVDIDPKMVQLAKTHPALLVQNERSFLDEKVTVHIEDAKGYISGKLEPYDVIIIDFPDPSDSIISSLYTKELFSKVALLLAEDGVLVCQSNSPEEAPCVFWSIGKTIEAAGFYTRGYKILVPSFGVWGFHLATKKELSEEIPEISVPHEALPKNMVHLFNLSPTILSERQHAIVNEVSNLRLHKVYEEEIQK